MAAAASQLRVIDQSRVSPPSEFVPPPPLPLTFFDIIHLDDPPVEVLYFYSFPHTTEHFMGTILPHLKYSLSLTLRNFYPFAASLTHSPIKADQLELLYATDNSIALNTSECCDDFNDITGSHSRSLTKINNLTPRLLDGEMLAIQATIFPGQGICIGSAFHHVVADGSSINHFITSWASMASCSLTGVSPSYDRTLFGKYSTLYSLLFSQLLKSRVARQQDMTDSSSKDIVCSTFKLKPGHVRRLKQMVQSSTFVIACAYVWVCLVKARGYNQNKTAHFLFLADCRQGVIQSVIPESYFGNCIRLCFAEAKVCELTGNDGFLVASRAIGDVVNRFKGEHLVSDAEKWLQKLHSIGSKELFSVSGSPKLKLYDTDFGWGKPVKVELSSIQYTGAMSMIQSRDESGGMEIGLVLPTEQIDGFRSHFVNGLKSPRL